MEQEITFTCGTVTTSFTQTVEVIPAAPQLPPPARVLLTDEQISALTRPYELRYDPRELSIFGPQRKGFESSVCKTV